MANITILEAFNKLLASTKKYIDNKIADQPQLLFNDNSVSSYSSNSTISVHPLKHITVINNILINNLLNLFVLLILHTPLLLSHSHLYDDLLN